MKEVSNKLITTGGIIALILLIPVIVLAVWAGVTQGKKADNTQQQNNTSDNGDSTINNDNISIFKKCREVNTNPWGVELVCDNPDLWALITDSNDTGRRIFEWITDEAEKTSSTAQSYIEIKEIDKAYLSNTSFKDYIENIYLANVQKIPDAWWETEEGYNKLTYRKVHTMNVAEFDIWTSMRSEHVVIYEYVDGTTQARNILVARLVLSTSSSKDTRDSLSKEFDHFKEELSARLYPN